MPRRQVFDVQPAALPQRQRVDREVHAVVCDRYVPYEKFEIPNIQIRKVDAVLFRADVEFPVAEIHVPDRCRRRRQPKSFFLLFLLFLEFQQDLFQVARPRTVLHQVEPHSVQFDVPEPHGSRENVQTAQRDDDVARIEQRVSVVVLYVKAFQRQPVEQPETHLFDRELGLGFFAEHFQALPDDQVLHRLHVQQQRDGDRQKYYKQDHRRHERSYYFYNFAHSEAACGILLVFNRSRSALRRFACLSEKNYKFTKFIINNKAKMDITILGIESSCDDTSAAVIRGRTLLSNVIASQDVHRKYGGVIPELASRAHQQNIIPVVDTAIREAGIELKDLDGIAFTRGPGLLGSLMVGVSFAKGLSLSLDIPMMDVNHLQGHISSHFIDLPDRQLAHPRFPFLCLLVSGGHSQIVLVKDYGEMEIVGTTIDDAAGEAFDKCAKVMGLPYPGGPVIDKLAKEGNPKRFKFAKPSVDGFNYSFSGLKTSFLYFLRDEMRENPNFIGENKADLCASLQSTIIEILLNKLVRAARHYDIRDIAIAGGVSANSGLRRAIVEEGVRRGWNTFLPEFKFTTDNAAMIAVTGYFKYQRGEFAPMDVVPVARISRM